MDFRLRSRRLDGDFEQHMLDSSRFIDREGCFRRALRNGGRGLCSARCLQQKPKASYRRRRRAPLPPGR